MSLLAASKREGQHVVRAWGLDCLSCRGACGCHVTRTAGTQRYWWSNCSRTVFCLIGSHMGSLILASKRYEMDHGWQVYAHIRLSRCTSAVRCYQWHTAQVVCGQELDNKARKLGEVHLERGVLEVLLKIC